MCQYSHLIGEHGKETTMTNRRELLKQGLMLGAGSFLVHRAVAAPVKSLLGGYSLAYSPAGGKGLPADFPYIANGLISMWDAEWNAGVYKHIDTFSMVDVVGNCADIVLSSEQLSYISSGMYCIEAATLVCSENAAVNNGIRDIVYDSSKSVTFQMIGSVKDVATRNSIVFASLGTESRFPGLDTRCENIPSINSVRGISRVCSYTSQSQANIQKNSQYNIYCVKFECRGGMQFRSSITNNYGASISTGSWVTSSLASRLPNEPDLVYRCITSGKIRLTMPVGSTFYSARFYNRALTDEEVLLNYVVDKERFGL